MVQDHFRRKLAAILSADVKGYSRLMREDEKATIEVLTAYREVMAELVKQHHGRVVDAVGDNLLAEFASVVDAVQGAVAIQKEVKARNTQIAENRKMWFRIGINLGDLVTEGDRIYGDGVNIAARLEALADPGGVCISRTAHEQIEDKLPFGYEYMGEKTVKNIVKPIRAYKVLFEPGDKSPAAAEADNQRRSEKHQKSAGGNGEIPAGSKEQLYSFNDRIKEMGARLKIGDRSIFIKHLWIYAAVIVCFFIINMLAWVGIVWFHWPALIWGLFLFIQWVAWVKDSKPESRRD